ncbi:MFS transporter [Tundrisphaera sp. TA3]|uniref:MFS transporter n=1 Tax=Tundrisphaera sp. TA3 TaxID=3435775 RepID=UPI003EB6E9C0
MTDRPTRADHIARVAVGVPFLALGLAVGSWLARLPEVKAGLGLDNGSLGLALLASSAGALFSMPMAGRLAPRLGAKRLAVASSLGMCLILPVIPAAGSVAALVAALAAYGATTGVMGVTVNSLAVQVEGRIGRPILSSFHALFSLGCLVGAFVASWLVEARVGPVESLAGTSALLALALGAASFGMPDAPARAPEKARARPRRELVILGGLAFLGFVGEGSMGDWGAIYLEEILGTTKAVAALGFAAYSLGMTAGRFGGDWLARVLGDERLLRAGATLSTLGLIGALASRQPLVATAGFALVGLGLANAVPILFRAASRVPGVEPVAGIAMASTIGYFGFLVGPPAIGKVAQVSSLPAALGLVAASIAVVAIGGGIVRSFAQPAKASRETRPIGFGELDVPILPTAEV